MIGVVDYIFSGFVALAYAAALIAYIEKKSFKILLVITIGFFLGYALFKTGLQYYVWSLGGVSKYLLPPYQSISYFLYYSWGHFWFNAVLTIAVSACFYAFLRIVGRYRPVLFHPGEQELAFLLALLVGWPTILIFVPVLFVLMLMRIVWSLYTTKTRVAMGPCLLIAACICILIQ